MDNGIRLLLFWVCPFRLSGFMSLYHMGGDSVLTFFLTAIGSGAMVGYGIALVEWISEMIE